MAAPTAISEAVERREAAQPRAGRRRAGVFLLGVAADALLLGIGFALAFASRQALGALFGSYQWASGAATQYLICALIFICVLLYEGAYEPGLIGVGQTEKLVKALTGGLIAAIFFSFVTHAALAISRPVLVLWYVANLALFALVRPVLRRGFVHWAGDVVLLAGAGAAAAEVAARLRGVGLQPVPARVCDPADGHPSVPEGTLCLVCVDGSAPAHESIFDLENRYGAVGLIPTGTDRSFFGATPVMLRGLHVYAICHPLNRRLNRTLKRAFDAVTASALLVLAAPFFGILALAVKLDSKGPVYYAHPRLGRHGRPFRALKFRTMQPDADRRLESLLASDPRLRAEFAAGFKLKDDPRVTRLGRWLRRTSLDELPQLWNVLRGEMSLVGPRPIVDAERPRYGRAYDLIANVRPGLTGVWQTSGRNDLAYGSRQHLDLYYVRHWSFWLDLSLLVRTVQALFLPDGY